MIITDSLLTDLTNAAKEGVQNAFTGSNQKEAPRFGAAVLTKNGNIFSAGQYFSDTLTLTLHSEQAAIAHASAHGEYEIVAIACIGNQAAYQISGGKIYPCHICKQLLWESHLRSRLNMDIFIFDVTGTILERLQINEMINYPWPLPIRDNKVALV